MEKEIFSIDVGRAALRMAMSETRDDEDRLKSKLRQRRIPYGCR